MAQNLPRGTPARVLVLLTLLTGLVVVSAWRDALGRETNTGVRYPTALGDAGLLLPGQLPAHLQTGGRHFTITSGGPTFHRRDDRMFRVLTGAPEGLPFSLFTTRETLPDEAEPKLYARTAPQQYLRLRASLHPSGAPVATPSRPVPASPQPPAPKAIPLAPGEQDFPDDLPPQGTL